MANDALDQRCISIVVPTYEEVESLPSLIRRVGELRRAEGVDAELIICDDDSADGTEELIEQLDLPWVRLITRKTDRGLSPAVLDGLRAARNEWLFVMDADLSHPPEKLPEMLAALDEGADFVIGSRYAEGGSTDAGWGVLRWLNSKVATVMARPFTAVGDPMAGFFGLRRETFLASADLNPIGYKIGLELLVKCGCQRVVEVPIHFEERKLGQSKLTLSEQLRYLEHLRRLFLFKFPAVVQLTRIAAVALLSLLAVSLLVESGLGDAGAIAGGALAASLMLDGPLLRRVQRGSIAKLAVASAFGLILHFGTALLFRGRFPSAPIQVAALAGLVIGMGMTYSASRLLVLRAPRRRARTRAVVLGTKQR